MSEFWWSAGFEAIKLGAQFGGALYIARKAVSWALSRYKQEKHWERKLQAYSDLLSALGTMDQVLNEWEVDELENRQTSDREDERNRDRYNTARQKLGEAVGVAELILSPEIAKLLSAFSVDLRNARHKAATWMEAIGEEWVVLTKLRQELLKLGRSDLELQMTPGTQGKGAK